jgi:hypothetical protein
MKSRRNRVPARRLIVLFLVSILGIILVSATVWASANSLPGDAFYGAKRLAENARRSFLFSKSQRAALEVEFAARRLDELERCGAGDCRLKAAAELDAALTKAALAVALVPEAEREELENRLVDLAGENATWIEQKLDQLVKTALSQTFMVPDADAAVDPDADDQGSLLNDVIADLATLTQAESQAEPETRIALFPEKTPTSHPFPREGAHSEATCEDCHTGTNFEQPPRECAGCHEDPHRGANGLACQSCHTVETFALVAVDHTGLVDCAGCHSDMAPLDHFTGQCSQCHIAGGSWSDASFSHSGYTDCQSCHTRPDGHFSGQCSQCHTTSGWPGGSIGDHGFPINHGGAGGKCSTCHSGNDFTTYSCSSCHNQSEIDGEHGEEGISDIANCARCHSSGEEPEHDDGGDDGDDGDDGDGNDQDRGGDDDSDQGGGDDEDRGDDGDNDRGDDEHGDQGGEDHDNGKDDGESD